MPDFEQGDSNAYFTYSFTLKTKECDITNLNPVNWNFNFNLNDITISLKSDPDCKIVFNGRYQDIDFSKSNLYDQYLEKDYDINNPSSCSKNRDVYIKIKRFCGLSSLLEDKI